MGRSRGGKRRTVLQLGEQKESYLKRYGYKRQEEYEEDGNQCGGESESDEEDGYPNIPEDDMEEIPLPPMPVSDPVKPKVDIDDKVANFLAEIDALEPEEEPTQSEDDADIKPSFAPIDPKPSFQLNVDQTPASFIETKTQTKIEPKPSSSYKSMFVQGASEFTHPKEERVSNGTKDGEEIWPDEPISDWQQILDDNTQCYYYWNIQTNVVRWEIPSEYTQYLLLRKEYEEKIDRLTKDGKVKPASSRQIRIAADGHHLIEAESESKATESFGPQLPPSDSKIMEKGTDESPCVSSTSNVAEQPSETSKKLSKISILKHKTDNSSYGPQLPDSTASKSKKPKLVDALYDDESDECSSTSSEIESEDEGEMKKVKSKKADKKSENGEEDLELDLDDIDKALELALEKKKSKEDEGKSSSSKKSEDKGIKKKTLVEEMREQVQKKQEVEARRKAAIEEMMARELERRVGPPRQSTIPEEPAFRPKVLDYEHGRKKSKPLDYDHDVSTASKSRDSDRDSKRKREERKSDRDRDKDKDRDKKRRKDEKDSHRKEKDDKEDRRKEKDEKKKDRHKDEKRSDSKRKEERSSKEDEKYSKKKEEKHDKKKSHGHSENENEIESKEKKVKVETEKDVLEKDDATNIKKKESKEALLANMRQQASELAELALSKLEFLEVTKKGLSKLQILLIELETRQYDWQSGGLDTEYFIKKLDEANLQLEHYEQNAAPPGWSCHWDRAYRRYFYMSKRSGRTQWDYPDEDEEEDENDEQESEREDVEMESPEQSEITTNSSEDKSDMLVGRVVEPELVTSTTLSSSKSNILVKADTTSSATGPSTLKPALKSKSALAMQTETVEEEDNVGKNIEAPLVLPSHDPKDIESALNFIIGSETPLAPGEPAPPGTGGGLDMLFIAPPPPPPPIEEYPAIQQSEDNPQDEIAMDSEPSIDVHKENSILNDKVDGDLMVEKIMSTNMVAVETNGISMSEMPDLEQETNRPHIESEAVEAVITRPPVVNIARPPQMLVNTGPVEGSSYNMNVPVVLNEGQSGNIAIQSVPYVTSSTSDMVAGSLQSRPAPSSSITDPSATTDVGHHADRKKKKKDKDKDKSISSASLTLKKKNVSSLVQKWQKVKMEVEIEERHREERDMAIRQKLEEWKKDHN